MVSEYKHEPQRGGYQLACTVFETKNGRKDTTGSLSTWGMPIIYLIIMSPQPWIFKARSPASAAFGRKRDVPSTSHGSSRQSSAKL